MIFSHEKKFLFIHNPKVAGTSVRKSIEQYDSSTGAFWRPFYLEKYERIVDRAHIPACEYDQHGLLEISEKYFTFGFVRDPYQRFLSAWEEFKYQHNYQGIDDVNEWAVSFLNESSIRYDWRLIHFCPQHYFFYVGNKCVADFIGRQESLGLDWFRVQKIIGINEPLGHYNKKSVTNKRNALDVLNPSTISLINRLYEKDFVLFNYTMLESSALNLNDPYQEFYEEALLPERALHHSLNEEIKKLTEQNNLFIEEKTNLSNNCVQLQCKIDSLSKDNECFNKYLNEKDEKLSFLVNDINDKNLIITNLYSSRSFKITAPLRGIGRFVRKFL
ncbi:sulfotransferase family 2 domain-containing protein [Erwinia sp. S59]|uniref:sulfotransferase family 2 domain-containing protein n=1 Tax=Erwinia sp. S59 TaxID=2769340 RepID=UPI001909BCDC|nr:sulfotransferase family 2 domain-containing protein [Erwinia sp. S59]MBK0092100.1 sulfotransferase family 2 domain-containing protein [Erwinia sp. S59]